MLKRIAATFLVPLLVATGLYAFHPASGQGNPTCPTRGVNDNSNACASTQYVANQINTQAAAQLSPIDIYLAIGDSNATGQGNAAQSPSPSGLVLEYCANGTIQVANDPTCNAVTAAQNANTGSLWPSLGIAYNRQIGLVLTGVSGSTQASACDFGIGNGNWQATTAGSNYQNSLTAINAALPAFIAAGYAPTFKGIIVIAGSNDGAQIDSSVCTSAQYTAGLTAMVANYRSATIGGKVNSQLPIYLPIIGTSWAANDFPGYQQVRSAQQIFATTTNNVSVPYSDLYSFANLGLLQINSAHPVQAGYNAWGTAMGAALNPQITTINPYTLFNANSAVGGVQLSGTVIQMVGANASPATILLDAYAGIPQIIFRRADTTLLSPTAIQANDVIGSFSMRSYGNDAFGSTNQIALLGTATQAHTPTAKGSQLCIFTTPNGSSTASCNLTIAQSGVVSAQTLSAGNIGLGAGIIDAPVTINQNTVGSPVVVSVGAGLHMIGGNGLNNAFTYDGFFNNGASGVNLFIARQANGTAAIPLALSAGNIAFSINTQGYDGTSNYGAIAALDFLSINQTSPSDSSGQIRFRTTPTGQANNLTQRLLIKQGIIVGGISTDPGVGVVNLSSQAFSNLTTCTTSLRGSIAAVSNSNTAVWGATVAGGGTNEVIAHCNGSNWTVMGD